MEAGVALEVLRAFAIPSFAYLCVYTLAVMVRFWLPPSYSMTFYYWERTKKGLGAFFNFFCFTVAIGAGACMIELAAEQWFQFLGFTAMAGLGLVGAAPYFLESETSQRMAHYIGAAICAVSAGSWMLCMGEWLILVAAVVLAVVATLLTGKRKWMFWFEFTFFYSPYLIFFKYLL